MNFFSNHLKTTFFTFSLIGICACVTPPSKIEKTNIVFSAQKSMEDSTVFQRCDDGGAKNGKYFTRVDSVNQYGEGIFYPLPDSLNYRNLRLVVSAWVRTSDAAQEKMIGASINDGQSNAILKWFDCKPANKNIELNTWTFITDSFAIDEKLNSVSGILLKVFPYNANGKGKMDVDDLQISLKTVDTLYVNP